MSIRLLKGNDLQMNGVLLTAKNIVGAPLSIKGINIFFSGGYLVVSADFGITIYWNQGKFDIAVCDAYSGLICGLCGNNDGNILK